MRTLRYRRNPRAGMPIVYSSTNRSDIMMNRILVALALVACSTFAGAQNCVGFTDVAGTSTFCPEVEWLKNRAITLGCTSTTLYCPNDVVNRGSMALLMQRLGMALSFEALFKDGAPGPIMVPDVPPSFRVCITADTAAATYSRTAILQGMFTGIADSNAIAWIGFLFYSTDGGTTWNKPVASSPAGRASST
jgi:hypothetical protein